MLNRFLYSASFYYDIANPNDTAYFETQLTGQITFMDPETGLTLAQYLSDNDILLHPYLWNEEAWVFCIDDLPETKLRFQVPSISNQIFEINYIGKKNIMCALVASYEIPYPITKTFSRIDLGW